MRQFFKFLFASCLGVILAIFIVGLVLIGVFAIAANTGNTPSGPKPNSVLEINFKNPVPELTNNLERDPFKLDEEDVVGLQDIIVTIARAKDDKNIKGIYLRMEESGKIAGLASASAIRKAVEDFKESGKFVIAHSNFYTQGSYYIASAADDIYLHPLGIIDFRGYAAVIPFFKDMLDKIGIKFQAFYAGDFKSATEPYRRTEMSDENRLQLREFLTEMYDLYLQKVGDARDISKVELDSIADNLLIKNAEAAKSLGFVDKVAYRDELLEDLRDRLGLGENEKIPCITLENYYAFSKDETDYAVKDKIAVVYSEGTIVDGKGEMGQTGDIEYVKIIEKLADDDKIKAIVMRINSPGGSVMASENIYRALEIAKQKGKKIVASMGDYAASGGYYIACPADSIFAENETLTGSIGVFSLFPDVSVLMNDKIGIHLDTVKTGRYAGGFNPVMGLSEGESAYFQNFVDEIYERFLKIVGESRNMSRDEVHKIAQGRVWSGRRAQTLGLVDAIGNMDRSISAAANMAGLEKYRVVTYPKPKEPIQQIIEKITGEKDDGVVKTLQKDFAEWTPYFETLYELKTMKGPQYRLPYIVDFK